MLNGLHSWFCILLQLHCLLKLLSKSMSGNRCLKEYKWHIWTKVRSSMKYAYDIWHHDSYWGWHMVGIGLTIWVLVVSTHAPEGRLNEELLSYHHAHSHYKYQTISRPEIIYTKNSWCRGRSNGRISFPPWLFRWTALQQAIWTRK